ncbi:hypothetical protein [Methanosarcina siciliae]|uniref:hypothetical protein n=1 Tax=Methanosarcina siciliae TaxID=38027 RepID=UPI00064EEC56|nr:hypothetical protein [Methanosarcina siciliae]
MAPRSAASARIRSGKRNAAFDQVKPFRAKEHSGRNKNHRGCDDSTRDFSGNKAESKEQY